MKRLLALGAWLAAVALLVEVYQPATILDPWYPSVGIVLLILVGVGAIFPAPEPHEAIPRETQIARYLMTLIGGTGGLSIALFLWSHMQSLSWQLFNGRWLGVYAALGVGLGIPVFAETKWGQKFLDHPVVRGVMLTTVSLLCFGVLAEIILRTDLMRYEILGVYPYEAAAANREARQQWGLSDSEFAPEKPEGVYRVVLIGDSFTYGYGVYADERFAHYLQELAPDHVQIIVLAYSGASTADQLTQWNSQQFEADIAIVGVVANDADMRLILPQEKARSRIFTPIFPRSQFAYFLDTLNIPRRLSGDTTLLKRGEWERLLYSDPATQAEWIPLVNEFQRRITAQGTQAWAYILTEPFDTENQATFDLWQGLYGQIEKTYREAGFYTVNTFEAYVAQFGERPYKDLCALPNDCHPAPELHRFFAELMWADLEPALEQSSPFP